VSDSGSLVVSSVGEVELGVSERGGIVGGSLGVFSSSPLSILTGCSLRWFVSPLQGEEMKRDSLRAGGVVETAGSEYA
jgi:hypothetical protein